MDIEDSANVKNTLLATLENQALINLKQAKESYAVALAHSRSDDMKSEGKYDTRAIEAGYLASAKKQRVEQLEAELLSLQRINLLSTSNKVVLGSVAQLERDLIAERVRAGLHNAKMKGVRIGRKKTRPSQLIRRLRSKGMVYREIARIAGCSPGAVSAEVRAWKKEQENGMAHNLEEDIPPLPVEVKSHLKSPVSKANPLEIVRF